jgi:hypothetical protein
MTARLASSLAPSGDLFWPNRARQPPLYGVRIHVWNFDRTLRMSADRIRLGDGAAGTDGIGYDNDKRFLALGAKPGAQMGRIYLKAAYRHGLVRNDDSPCDTDIRLLAVYAF